jgi:hypothetical protein
MGTLRGQPWPANAGCQESAFILLITKKLSGNAELNESAQKEWTREFDSAFGISHFASRPMTHLHLCALQKKRLSRQSRCGSRDRLMMTAVS